MKQHEDPEVWKPQASHNPHTSPTVARDGVKFESWWPIRVGDMEKIYGAQIKNIITGRNEVVAKVIFLQQSVILFRGGLQ